MVPQGSIPELTPVRIAAIYTAFGLSWILFSDTVLWTLTADPTIRLQIEAAKGILFVLISGGLVYWLSARARQRQRQARTQVEQQARELSIFHRILRHNLRNIATVIGGRAEAAREPGTDNPHLSVIEQKADRLTTLAEKASLIRNVSGEVSATWIQQDIPAAVEDICQQRRERHPNVDITVEGPDQLETMAPSRLGFAVSELIANAIVHAGDTPHVTVRIEATEGEIRITVADDGPGLPDVERTAIEGNIEAVLDHSEGVGLWLVRLIVENAGGRAEIVDSELDGAAIRLAFPRIEES